LLKLAMQRPELFAPPERGRLAIPSPDDAALVRTTLRAVAIAFSSIEKAASNPCPPASRQTGKDGCVIATDLFSAAFRGAWFAQSDKDV